MSTLIKCDGCGTMGSVRDLSGWQSNTHSKSLFCTNACYAKNGLPFECVPVIDLNRKIAEAIGLHSIIYKDQNVQISVSKLKAEESIKRETHPNSTQTIIVLQGRVQVTIFVAEIPYTVELAPGTEKTLIIIPCGTEHEVVSLGVESTLYSTYSPPPFLKHNK